MRLYKRGKVYWYELVFEGQRIQRSTKMTNRKEAGEIASTEHARMIKEGVGIFERRKPPSFKEAMDSFLDWSAQEHAAHPNTTKRYRTSSKPLLAFYGTVRIDGITADEVERYKVARGSAEGKRTKRPITPACINRELACLRACVNHVIKKHPQLRNPISKASGVKLLAEQNEQDRVLTFAEQRKYTEKATPVLRDVATLILETGMRPEEVYSIRGSSVDLEHGYLKVLKGKTKAARRRVELNPEARAVLEARLETYGSGYLFPKKGGKPGAPERHIPKVSNAHDRAVRDSGVQPFRLYDLRHTWATRAAEAGIDVVTLAAMLGHSKLAMVTRYCHPTQGHQMSAMERLAMHNAAREAKEKAAESGLKVIPRRGA